MSLFIKRNDFPIGTIRGACYTCNGVQTPLVDIQMQVDFEGYIIFCKNCAEDIGSQVGMATQADFDRVTDIVTELDDAFTKLKVKYSLAEDAITSLRRYDDDTAKVAEEK